MGISYMGNGYFFISPENIRIFDAAGRSALCSGLEYRKGCFLIVLSVCFQRK